MTVNTNIYIYIYICISLKKSPHKGLCIQPCIHSTSQHIDSRMSWWRKSQQRCHRTCYKKSSSKRTLRMMVWIVTSHIMVVTIPTLHWPKSSWLPNIHAFLNSCLSHWDSNKMATSEQKTYSNELSPKKMSELNWNSTQWETTLHSPSQWETMLHCNVVSQWLGEFTNQSLHISFFIQCWCVIWWLSARLQ